MSYRINLVCECGRALGKVAVGDGAVELKVRPGCGNLGKDSVVLRCPRPGGHANLSVARDDLNDRARKAAQYGRRELVVGVDL